jgi:hypothetical protein
MPGFGQTDLGDGVFKQLFTYEILAIGICLPFVALG